MDETQNTRDYFGKILIFMKDGISTHGESVLLWLHADIFASLGIYQLKPKTLCKLIHARLHFLFSWVRNLL